MAYVNNNRLITAHVVYGVLLLVFGVAVAAIQEATGGDDLFFSVLAEVGLVVPLAMILALRFSRLRLLGVALTGGVVSLLALVVGVAIYSYLAQPVGLDRTLVDLYASKRGMTFLITSLVTIVAGIIWFFLLQQTPLWLRARKSSP